jgi:cytoskeletal protein RodZ
LEPYNIGARLQERRLELGLSLDDIVERTRIQPRFLEAIESNELSAFPGIVFTRNFVRQYALALELDPQPLLESLPKLDQSTVPLPEAPNRPPVKRTRLHAHPQWVSAAWAVAAALAVTGAYLYHNQGWRITVERRAPAEQDTVKAESIPSPAPAPVPAAAPAPAVAQAEPEPQAPPPAAVTESTDPADAVQVVLTAHERSWVSVKVDGKSGYSYIGTLTPNETRTISATEQVKIVTGNAGGITISLNGKTLDPIGRHGQFRTLRLTAEGSELLTKESPPANGGAATDPL